MTSLSSEKAGTRTGPRILLVTPEVSILPGDMGAASGWVSVRTGMLADLCSALIGSLDALGADIHVAIPNYRNIFRHRSTGNRDQKTISRIGSLPRERVHLAQDRTFFYPSVLCSSPRPETIKIALAFQREVIHCILPEVRPDLVHCCDWMTGLIPAVTRELGIPCLYTLSSLNTAAVTLSVIEDRGIDAASFWQHCYYQRMPAGYGETRESNPVDILTSAVFAAHFVNTPSPTLMAELVAGRCPQASPSLAVELVNKLRAGCLAAATHAPGPGFDPAVDTALFRRFTAEDHHAGKLFNKLRLQERLGLAMDSTAPLFFWPGRLDSDRPGCRLMAEALRPLLARFFDQGMQLAFVADGDFHDLLCSIGAECNAADRIAVCRFDAGMHRLAYAAADFVLVPSLVEPSGLAGRIAQRYGALPIVYDAGGSRDAVSHLDAAAERGSGFVFGNFDVEGLLWAVGRAIDFFGRSPTARARQVRRIMTESRVRCDPADTADQYIGLYERMLQRPMDHLRSSNRASEDRLAQTAA